MKTIMKGLVGLVLVLVLLLGALAWRGQSILAREWQIAIAPRTATLPPPDLAEGKRLATIRGCLECHGADLGGQVLAQAPIGDLVPPNLTRGKGSVVAAYTADDWERAIRHGVGPGGRPLILMPSDDNTTMSEADYAAMLAYIQSVPPVDRENPPTRLTLLGSVLLGAGQLPLLAAGIDGGQIAARFVQIGEWRPAPVAHRHRIGEHRVQVDQIQHIELAQAHGAGIEGRQRDHGRLAAAGSEWRYW